MFTYYTKAIGLHTIQRQFVQLSVRLYHGTIPYKLFHIIFQQVAAELSQAQPPIG